MNKPTLAFRLVSGFFMSLCMSTCMSFFMTLINTGYDSLFWMRWLRAFCVGICVAFPTAFIFAPFVQSLAAKLTTQSTKP